MAFRFVPCRFFCALGFLRTNGGSLDNVSDGYNYEKGGFLVAVSAARANMQKKAHMRAHLRNIPYDIEWREKLLKDKNLDAEKRARARKALATIKELTNMEASE
jgi:hypothetical protein